MDKSSAYSAAEAAAQTKPVSRPYCVKQLLTQTVVEHAFYRALDNAEGTVMASFFRL